MRTIIGAVVVLLALGMTTPARAESITVAGSISGSGAAAGMFDIIGVPFFNPALGTLNRVDVDIRGTLAVDILTFPNGAIVGGVLIPIASPFVGQVTQDFDGLGNTFFDFSPAASFDFTGIASGLGETVHVEIPFVYDFAFTAVTDLAGFAVNSAASGHGEVAGGTRAGFLPAPFGIHEIDLLQTAVASAGVTPLITSADGAIFITYDYTAAAPVPDPNSAVPEPASLLLLATGLAGAAWRRTRSVAK